MSEPNDQLRERPHKPLTKAQKQMGDAMRELIKTEGLTRSVAFVCTMLSFWTMEPLGLSLDQQVDVADELEQLLARRVRELGQLNRRN